MLPSSLVPVPCTTSRPHGAEFSLNLLLSPFMRVVFAVVVSTLICAFFFFFSDQEGRTEF